MTASPPRDTAPPPPPAHMSAMVLTRHGGLDALEWRTDMPTPRPAEGQVLIHVGAAAVNNTDVNTRIGWYSKSVRGDTGGGGADGFDAQVEGDGGWDGAIAFPRIQGADCCGRIVAVGGGVSEGRLGERVILRPMQPTNGPAGAALTTTLGSEQDGGFAQYVAVGAAHAVPVDSPLSDLELASFPCAYSTAEGMLQRVGLGAERVLITGAAGGVGSAAVQLARRRGAQVAAVTSPSKAAAVAELGAGETVARDGALPANGFDVVVDLVGGPRFPELLEALRPGGRYVVSGAIAGPIAELDLRTLYLKDLTLFGSTAQPMSIMTDLAAYIERGEIRPLIAATYPLKELKAAQTAFLDKGYVGKIAIDVAGGC